MLAQTTKTMSAVLCSLNELEDEYHFVITGPVYNDLKKVCLLTEILLCSDKCFFFKNCWIQKTLKLLRMFKHMYKKSIKIRKYPLVHDSLVSV